MNEPIRTDTIRERDRAGIIRMIETMDNSRLSILHLCATVISVPFFCDADKLREKADIILREVSVRSHGDGG